MLPTEELSMTTATRQSTVETIQRQSRTRVAAENCIFLARYTTPPERALQAVVRTAVRRWAADAWSFDTPDLWMAIRCIVRRKVAQRKNTERTARSLPTDARTIVADEVSAVLKDLPPEYARLMELKIRPLVLSNTTVATILQLSPEMVSQMEMLLRERLSARFMAE